MTGKVTEKVTSRVTSKVMERRYSDAQFCNNAIDERALDYPEMEERRLYASEKILIESNGDRLHG